MSLNMYLGEVHTQTQSMNAVCTATIQGMEQAIQSIDVFTGDTVLQGQTYDSAKAYFAQTFRPLAQGIIYLCEELIRQNDAFPSQFQSQVASTDVNEQEILEQIQGIDRMRAGVEGISNVLPAMQAMMGIFDMMKRKLQEKLEHLHEFNYTSSSNYDTALQLAASIATGLAEVQSGKGFSPASGTFSTQGLDMEWATSIQAIEEERARQATNLIEEGAMCGKLPPKSDFEKAWERDKKDLSDAWTGISTGFVDGAVDAWEGFVALGDKETWLNMRDAIINYKETLPAAWNALSDSFINDFWNGDMESREHYAAYGVASLLTGFIGDKGLSKAGQAGKVAIAGNLAKGKSFITNSAAYRNVLNDFKLNTGNRFAYADVGGSSIKYELGGAYQEAKDLLNQFAVSKEEYKDLRKRTPNNRIRKSVNTDVPKVDPVYGYEVEKLEADHIVSMKEITDMEGFDLLPREQQIEVLNMDVNFVGLGKPTNASKNAKDWSTWPGHPKYGKVPEIIRLEMLEREAVAREALKKSIKERLQSIENNS
ncbi:cytoplasmic protein [Bacillus clarus]|uniref:Cytoplasmic protein n=1 Tax=Bacillus clarus TaxID=2338372 RepID=A0A090YU92_9BACI|nr:T7SS effector LXG polymorphic toxin [Bacillus clarus]KFM95620.1 LXG domain of WXG superfamily protein [Bacillus clarus]RFT64354.1 cytoplasmic protein [Bacillus clarus]